MSKSQLRNCGNKRRFLTKADAVAAVADRKLGVYVCPVCAGFHLTRQTRPVASKAEKSVEPEKPVFDRSLLGRARWKKAGS